MRILVVSAHYPPNFVSGGTLVPQRLARGLRARGHEVTVYAGWLGDEKQPLETWEEIDDTGLPVRWIVTSPWIWWDNRRNFDNPEVAADLARFIAGYRPDVVHAHSLQTVGAGVLEAARRAGAKVVVTMHDFWWVCARQFLVDKSWRPCALVVDAGSCACEVDHEWLERRNAWLRERLAAVDLVLAPSAPAAEVLAANGVDADRLEVDENGLDDDRLPDPGRVGSGEDGDAEAGQVRPPLRLLYAGGSNRLKGVEVLLAAASRLADRRGWSLRAHGIERYLEEVPDALVNLPVEALAAFDPDSVDHAFRHADVLVVPSLMRESHSLLTREALVRGVPVVCTDCIGPEEVVTDGQNGLVVPSADHRALARAIERLVDEPDLVDRLRAGCGRLRLRPVEDQVAGLESRYERLLATGPEAAGVRAAAGRREPDRVVFLVGIDGAPLRYRGWLPAEGLRLLGVQCELYHYRDEQVRRAVVGADAVVVYRVPASPQILELLESIRASGTPVFFDVDDLIFDPQLAPEIPALRLLPEDEARLWMEGVCRYRTTMEACDAFIGSTATLCDHATRVAGLPSFRFENGVGVGLARASADAAERPRTPGPARIGYLSGTTTHDEDWAMIEPVAAAVLERVPDMELWLVGHAAAGPELDRFGDRVRRVPFQPWPELPGILRDIDVNLAPLTPGSRFNEAKSAIKWLEAALVGTPTVASPTQPFRDSIEDGRTGLLASTPEEWEAAILRLVVDPPFREFMGRRAQRAALLRWSPHLQGRRYRDILTDELPSRRRPQPWSPVTVDEPFMASSECPDARDPVAQERLPGEAAGASPGPDEHPGSPPVLVRIASVGRRGAAHLRTGGPSGAARAALRFAGRQARARIRRP